MRCRHRPRHGGTARGFGGHLECRGHMAEALRGRREVRDGLRLVHACVSDYVGLGTLVRAADSSSMNASSTEDPGAAWKRRREKKSGASTEPVPVTTLDAALSARSLDALGWSALRCRHSRIPQDRRARPRGRRAARRGAHAEHARSCSMRTRCCRQPSKRARSSTTCSGKVGRRRGAMHARARMTASARRLARRRLHRAGRRLAAGVARAGRLVCMWASQ